MTTYNSYAEAKIANPDLEILEARPDWDGSPEYVGTFTVNKSDGNGGVPYIGKGAFQKSNPADHCMTVEKFLADGHKFVRGDVVVDAGKVGVIETGFEINAYNEPDGGDSSIFILRAAALEEKPKRVEVSYVKVGAPCDFFDLKHEFRKEQLFFKNEIGKHETATTLVELVAAFDGLNLYRKVETEIDWRDELENHRYVLNAPYYSMRNHPDRFIAMCHAVAEMTDRPTN